MYEATHFHGDNQVSNNAYYRVGESVVCDLRKRRVNEDVNESVNLFFKQRLIMTAR